MFKANNKDTRIFDFEHVISGWVEHNSHVYDLLYRFIGNLAYSKLYRKLDGSQERYESKAKWNQSE